MKIFGLFIVFQFMFVTLAVSQTSYGVPICAFNSGAPLGDFSDVYVRRVAVAGIDNTTGGTAGGSRDYRSTTGNVSRGTTYSVTLGYSSSAYSTWIGMWVDWNDDGDFSDANEVVQTWLSNTTNTAGSHSFNMTVPADAALTSVRMRVMDGRDNTVAVCGGYFWGENEEYELNVSAGCTNASISSHPSTSSASTCLNGTAFSALSVTAAGSATLSYQWQQSANGTSGWSNASGGSGATTASYTPPNSTAGTLYYRCVVTSSCNSSTATSNASGAITVNALPTTVTVTGGGAICSGSSTSLGASNSSSGTIYWQNTTSSGTSTATASTSQSVSSAGTYYFRAQSAQGCWGTEGSATITVNALPTTVTVTGGGAICSGSSTNLGASNGSSGTIYWQNTTSSGTSTATASTSQSVSSAGTYYFRAQSAQGCWGTQGSATITVNALPTITASTGGARGVTAKASIQATSSAGTISWYAASSGGTSIGTSNSAVNWTTPSIASTTTYYAEAVNGSCVSASRTSVSATVSDGLIIIGKENSSSFLQKQTNNTTDSLRVFVSTYAIDNASNNGTITNDVSYIAIANNGGKLKATSTSNAEKPSGIYSRFEREWQVTNTNFSDDFSLEIEWLNAGNVTLSDLRLLVDSDGDFSNATAYSAADGLTFEIGSIIVRGIKTTMIPSGSSRFITIGSASSSTPLPIDLLFFKAELNENTVDVSWKTAFEANNDYFIIEKSYDGHIWTKVTDIKSIGNSSLPTNYSWIDVSNDVGLCYYKLTQVDKDGTQKSFDMVSVLKNQPNVLHEILLYPNPTNEQFSLEYLADNEDEFTVIIESDNGQEVYNQIHKINKGGNILHISSMDFANGLYLVLIENSHGLKVSKKIIKD